MSRFRVAASGPHRFVVATVGGHTCCAANNPEHMCAECREGILPPESAPPPINMAARVRSRIRGPVVMQPASYPPTFHRPGAPPPPVVTRTGVPAPPSLAERVRARAAERGTQLEETARKVRSNSTDVPVGLMERMKAEVRARAELLRHG